jgi:hypothetical protein
MLAMILVLALGPGLRAGAAATMTRAGDGVVVENARIRATIDPHGGRIASLINKATGKDLISLWTRGSELGGALDDRLTFTGAEYRLTLEKPSGETVLLRMDVSSPDGTALRKTITVRGDEPILRADYEFSNGTQVPQVFWVRNFFLPGGPPLDERLSYALPLKGGLTTLPVAAEMYEDLSAPWAAMFNQATHEGLVVAVPGLQKFYFWQGSKLWPTTEWIYSELPPGKRMKCSVALEVLNGETPDWQAVTKPLLPSVPELAIDSVPGWVDEATRFGVTAAEREDGFWLSTGYNEGKRRLPKVEIDLPQDQERSLYVALNALADGKNTPVGARLSGDAAPALKIGFERAGPNMVTVDPLPGSVTADLAKNTEYRIWLEASSRGKAPGKYSGTLALSVARRQQSIPVELRVWPVRVPEFRPFEVRGYGDLDTSTAPENLRRVDQVLSAYERMGGTVVDWFPTVPGILQRLKLAATGKGLVETTRTDPAQISLDHLPALDFSYFNPWVEVEKKHGVNRVECYIGLPDDGWQPAFLEAAVGKGRVKANSPEAERVVAWVMREAKHYFEQHEFRGFFCRISDEMPPENIPKYIASARLARQGGWRPFSTITMSIAGSPELIEELAPYCDQWQLSMMLKDDFHPLTEGPKRRVRLKPGDEVWFYGGNANPFKARYETTVVFPLFAAVEGDKGYAFWAFQSGTESVVWYDPAGPVARLGPAYLGLRDGWEDAKLFWLAVRDRQRIPFAKAASERADALFRVAVQTLETYRYKWITNIGSPAALNTARRELLRALAEKP